MESQPYPPCGYRPLLEKPISLERAVGPFTPWPRCHCLATCDGLLCEALQGALELFSKFLELFRTSRCALELFIYFQGCALDSNKNYFRVLSCALELSQMSKSIFSSYNQYPRVCFKTICCSRVLELYFFNTSHRRDPQLSRQLQCSPFGFPLNQ